METPTFHKEILAVSTAAGASGSIGYPGDPFVTRNVGFHVKWVAFATAGTVVIEVADSTSYTGTWATQTTLTASAGSQQYYTATAPALAWRARIANAVLPATTGVSVTIVGN